MPLYTFVPAASGWSASNVYSDAFAFSEITDSFDYRVVSTELNSGNPEVWAHKTASNIGRIKQFKGSIWLSKLPDYDQE